MHPVDTLYELHYNLCMKDNIKRVIDVLRYEKMIPRESNFDITENIINEYVKCYHNLHGKKNGKYDFKYARKLAGINLLKLKISEGETYKSCKEGILYFIENPAFPEHYKVGMTVDLPSRLKSYQVYDPHQLFSVHTYDFVLDRRSAEKKILNCFSVNVENGEWIKKVDAIPLIKEFALRV